jgi:hypothetical protein
VIVANPEGAKEVDGQPLRLRVLLDAEIGQVGIAAGGIKGPPRPPLAVLFAIFSQAVLDAQLQSIGAALAEGEGYIERTRRAVKLAVVHSATEADSCTLLTIIVGMKITVGEARDSRENTSVAVGKPHPEGGVETSDVGSHVTSPACSRCHSMSKRSSFQIPAWKHGSNLQKV